jgi:hypothetical protein
MLRNLTIRIINVWSSLDLCAGLQKTSKAAETSTQALWGTWCPIIKTVNCKVPQPSGILLIIFV